MNNYSTLLSDLIDKSGLSLTEISARAEKHGQKITTSYLSKLKNGKMPPPSFKISIALALCLDVDPELLLSAGVKDNIENNQEELKKELQEVYPDLDHIQVAKKVDSITKEPDNAIMFTKEENDLLHEQDLSLESLKDNYNLEIDGKPATTEEIEEMIKHVKLYRIMKQMEGS
jgi:transcriptional regulator with XRE-family HTH domain